MATPGFGIALLERIQGEVAESRTGQRLTGARLRDAVAACAHAFREAADQVPGPILLALELSLESILAYLGALASGRTLVPVDAKEWQQKGREMVEMLQPAVCWFPSRMAQVRTQATGRALHGFPTTPAAAVGEADARSGRAIGDGDDLVAGARVMVPTSGSTGKPSLVRVSDANLFANTADIVASQALTGRDKSLLCLPLNYCFGASVLHSHLWVGGSVVVDDRMIFPEKVLDALELEQCTTFAGVPTSFLFLQARSSVLKRNFPSLRLWLQAGGYLAASVVNAFREAHPKTAFAVMYGQTEATARIAAFIVDGEYPRGCVGYPMTSLQVEIRTEDGTVNGPGKEGDVWIRGASVCAGYYGDSEREADKFVDGWLNTGDIGHLLEDGRLCITGRADGFIKVRGRRIGSHEIEDLIWRELGVHSCACAIPDSSSGEVIGLLLESHDRSGARHPSGNSGHALAGPGHDGAEGVIEADWAERVRRALPQHWDLGPVMCGELPLTSSGKINRRACFMLLAKEGEATCR
ncbi:MAG: acyl--CoA ligase [Zoogloeaceae bacterium]|nr:acyl--CoA ligase [Zoogloeaceae bacterium]MCG3168445.1 Long-chain-fatty-acid--CoA ligase [Bacteroidia bacterium]HNQ56242.1 class I adenylate-forming enzyme family protein [Candidatus Desulfobacillus denitrificans]HNT61503.1 class I adenylate-forming enzyme family protein [Candidatus Desulfobacillus denitrificans]